MASFRESYGPMIDMLLAHLEDPHAFVKTMREEVARDPDSLLSGYYTEAADVVERLIAEGVY